MAVLEETLQKIETLARKVLEEGGMELVELKLSGPANDLMVRITADKPLGGITIEECAIMNKHLVAAIGQENLLPPEAFSLELSSPGLDRPLVTRKDFMRVVGCQLHFWLNQPVAGKKEIEGTLQAVGESTLTVASPKFTLELPLAAVIKGMLVF